EARHYTPEAGAADAIQCSVQATPPRAAGPPCRPGPGPARSATAPRPGTAGSWAPTSAGPPAAGRPGPPGRPPAPGTRTAGTADAGRRSAAPPGSPSPSSATPWPPRPAPAPRPA